MEQIFLKNKMVPIFFIVNTISHFFSNLVSSICPIPQKLEKFEKKLFHTYHSINKCEHFAKKIKSIRLTVIEIFLPGEMKHVYFQWKYSTF